MIGKTVAHYQILERLGGGGMGVVYKAQDTRLGRPVALKFLPPHLDFDREARERFIREAKAASALDHANICVVHEIGETDDGQLFLCMAFYEGESVKKRLERGPLAVQEAVDLGHQIASGLARAHEEGIVHRDIKSANVMVTARGEAKIVDFGLASLASEGRLTRTGTTLGTFAYMSPEQARGETVDARSDLWSLGVVLYEMLTGRLPFQGANELALAMSIQQDQPPPPISLRSEVPAAVSGLVMRLLAKRAEDRPVSAESVARQLASAVRAIYLGHLSAHTGAATVADGEMSAPRAVIGSEMQTEILAPAAPPPAARRRVGSTRGRRLAIAGAVAAALALIAGLLLTIVPRDPRRAAPGRRLLAVLPFENFTGDPANDYLCDGVAAGLITRLSEVAGLQVVGRSEAWADREEALGAGEVGRRLGVGLILEGAVQGTPDRLRIETGLLDVGTVTVVWSEELIGSADGIFDLQERLANRLIEVLSVSVSDRERERLAQEPTKSFQAYDAYLRGQKLLEQLAGSDQLGPAEEMFRQAIRIDPEFALAWAALSDALWNQAEKGGDRAILAAAEEAAAAALELDPDLPAARLALARVHRSTGRYTDAIAELEDVLRDLPRPDRAHRELAVSYERVGDLEAAESSFRAATTAGPDNWFNWNALGAFLWRGGDYEEASAAFERAAELAPPGVTLPQENLATVALSQGRADAAIAAYERIAKPIRSARLASNIGTAYYFSSHAEKWSRAEEHFRLAVKLNPRNDTAHRNLADLFLQLGRDEDAQQSYREALRIVEDQLAGDPHNYDLRLRRSFYAAKANDCSTAVELAGELAGELPETAQNVHRLAYVYALCGQRQEALEALRRAIDLGVSSALIEKEDEFRGLRDDPDFRRLIAGTAVPGA